MYYQNDPKLLRLIQEAFQVKTPNTVIDLERKEYLYRESSNAKFMYVIMEGLVFLGNKQYSRPLGQSFLLGPGDVLGSFNHGHDDHSQFAQTLVNSRILVLTEDEFQLMIKDNFDVLTAVVGSIKDRMEGLEDLFISFSRRSTEERIRHFFSKILNAFGTIDGNTIAIKNFLTHKKIASLIGVSRQSVTTWFNILERQGLLKYSRDEILVSKNLFQEKVKKSIMVV